MHHHSRGHADNEGLWDWNLESNRIHFSPQWIALAGCQDHEVGNTPQEWFERVHPQDSEQLSREVEVARTEASEFEFRYRLRHRNGTYRWMSCRGIVVRNERGDAVRMQGTQSDVTVETVTDSVTGLPNRLLLADRLNQSILRAHRYDAFHFALLVVDLGRPPAAPADARPSSGADALLTAAARRLETSLRIPDTPPSLRHNDLVARLDGDRFAVLLDGLKDVGRAKVVGDRILSEMLAPFTLGGYEVRLSASIGIAVSATGYTDANEVLRDAHTALHRAQVLGGCHAEIFDTAILKSERTELQLESDFEAALERREFKLFYQPIVSLDSNEVVGFEALVRWDHPVLGMVPPVDFVPVAERTGFIVPLGEWILGEACRQLSTWRSGVPDARDLWVSVNLSAMQLQHPGLIGQVNEALRVSALGAQSLVLELTEGVAMENPAAVKTLLMRLRAMGIRISIDDFGTGYSSLAYLRQFPVDTLKVDRSFVRGVESHKDSADIVSSMMLMAQQLGLSVVAEGIENDDQAAVLRSLRCDSAQGYLFAKPLDVSRATDLLKTGLPRRAERAGVTAMAVRSAGRQPSARSVAAYLPMSRRIAAAAGVLLAASVGVLLATQIQSSDSTAQQAGYFADRPLPPEQMVAGAAGAFPNAASPAEGRGSGQPPPVTSAATAESGLSEVNRTTSPAAQTLPPALRPSAPAEPSATEPATLSVLHLHRLGHCQGRLIIARDVVSFVPDENTSSDVFEFAYGEFLHTVDESTLTIRSHTRTYRFKPVTGVGRSDGVLTLAQVGAAITRFRRGVSRVRERADDAGAYGRGLN